MGLALLAGGRTAAVGNSGRWQPAPSFYNETSCDPPVFEPIAAPRYFEDLGVMQEAVEDGLGGGNVAALKYLILPHT
jgi:hypothetical protein